LLARDVWDRLITSSIETKKNPKISPSLDGTCRKSHLAQNHKKKSKASVYVDDGGLCLDHYGGMLLDRSNRTNMT
jgi:hypothetical protein